MQPPDTPRRLRRPLPRGFALVACVLVMALVALVVVGLLSLSAVAMRQSTSDQDVAAARANARLALMQAIGQLQTELGPDQRVSATSGILVSADDPNWTGVWSTRRDDRSSFWDRDPKTGSLIDYRNEEGWDAETEARAWLVSGDTSPRGFQDEGDTIQLVGSGSVEDDKAMVRVPLVDIKDEAGGNGGMAWWTGDLGVRANVSTPNRFADQELDSTNPGEGYYRLMAAQHAEPAVIGDGIEIDADKRAVLVTPKSLAVGGETSREWTRKHFHDYTTASQGLLIDVSEGGLKSDLTAYFQSNGEVPGLGEIAGLSDTDSIIAGGANSRRRIAGPRYGLLRDWATSTAPFSGRGVESYGPATDSTSGGQSEEFALSNENPVKLKGGTETSLKPILVEASKFGQISTYDLGDKEYQMRFHLYPRVVLWNPYNVELRSDDMIVMIQGNGRVEMRSDGELRTEFSTTRRSFVWLNFEGGRSTSFYEDASGTEVALMASEGYNDPYMGSYYFMVPATTMGPGECLVFSAESSKEYDSLSAYRQGAYDLSENRLSCEVAPDPSRSYYVSDSILEGGSPWLHVRYWYAPIFIWSAVAADGKFDSKGVVNQADDTRVVVKKLEGDAPVTFERFDELPQLAYISASLQYGAGREPRVKWDNQQKMDIELLAMENPKPTLEPDPRTREGIRLRWFDEPYSNILNAGSLNDQEQFFEEAFFANWNPRAAYAVRSPWENIGGSMPESGSAGGPWFFGLYTRDLADNAVGWDAQEPVYRDGRYHGNPFGPPQESTGNHVLFELPRTETGVVSLGQLQNAQMSEFVWHPSFAIGNSLVDPRLGLDDMDRTVPPSASDDEDSKGGFHPDVIGWSGDTGRSASREEWAETARVLLQNVPDDDHVVYDLSYELNHALWDRFFLSSGSRDEKEDFVDDPGGKPLPNGRLSLAMSPHGSVSVEDLSDYHRAAFHLSVNGAFNVNSTSVEAWKAMLSATREAGLDQGTPFARFLDRSDELAPGNDAKVPGEAWQAMRLLSDEEIGTLAEEIVGEVRKRGPFLSMADFVNRRLGDDETSRKGALQAAIDQAGINEDFHAEYPIDNGESLANYSHPDNIRDATRLEQSLKPASKVWGVPGYLTQGDVLQVLAPALSARSDSFVIRAYGESRNESGEVTARAWCEAVIQRTPQPIKPDETGLNPENPGEAGDFGRRFVVSGFRWLRPEEV